MRTSLLSRSVIAVATLGIGSVALAAVPASAATASGITRDQVLAAAAGVRSEPVSVEGQYSPSTDRALRVLANRACSIDRDGTQLIIGFLADATDAGASADGVVVTAVIADLAGQSEGYKGCSFGALATTDGAFTLSGSATLGSAAPVALSGDAFATAPVIFNAEGEGAFAPPAFTASGSATRSFDVTTSTKVKDKKTKSEKKAAKTTYAKRLAAAKKSYQKALDKAGKSKSKKAKAKKAYSAKRATARAAYKYAIAGYKIVKKTTQQTETRPFTVSAQAANPDAS